ncbi:agmatine deiminase family protein, partial [Bacteroidota bacterium]
AEMSEDIMVTTVVSGLTEENTVRSTYTTAGVNLDNCNFVYAPVDSYWSRDYSPWYIIDGNNDVGIINFPYNRPRPNDNDIPIEMAEFINVELYGMNLIHTGGNYMTDGYGIAASTDLVISENLSLSVSDIEQKVEDYLGITNYYLCEDPLGEYIEHIDCWGKFLDVDKILIGAVSESDSRYEDFEEMAEFWADQISSYGTNYQVFRTYSPNGQPYTNSLILNRKVLVPIVTGYGSDWNDSALAVYEAAMPGYEVIGFEEYAYAPWENTDALHCRAHGIADRNMLIIKHIPVNNQGVKENDIEIEAQIITCSDTTLKQDSLFIYFAVNDNEYQQINMTQKRDSTYLGYIPAQEIGSTIKYYLFAKDNAQNVATHPYIGEVDAHVFVFEEMNQLPQFMSVPDTTAVVDEEYTYQINVTDGNVNDTIELGYNTKPFWLSFNNNEDGSATLTGSPGENNLGASHVKLFATDGINTTYQEFDISVTTTPVFEYNEKSFRMYPNPVVDNAIVRISSNVSENMEIGIFSIYGQLVQKLDPFDLQTGKQLFNLNTSELIPGIYLTKFKIGESVFVKKLVKAR